MTARRKARQASTQAAKKASAEEDTVSADIGAEFVTLERDLLALSQAVAMAAIGRGFHPRQQAALIAYMRNSYRRDTAPGRVLWRVLADGFETGRLVFISDGWELVRRTRVRGNAFHRERKKGETRQRQAIQDAQIVGVVEDKRLDWLAKGKPESGATQYGLREAAKALEKSGSTIKAAWTRHRRRTGKSRRNASKG
jgi:hypothetical protein